MSRIGKKPVPVPEGVKVQVADHTIMVEGKLGKLQWEFRPEVSVAYDDGAKSITVSRQDDRTANSAAKAYSRISRRLCFHRIEARVALISRSVEEWPAGTYSRA